MKKIKSLPLKKLAIPLIILIAIAVIGAGYYLYQQNKIKNNPSAGAKQEITNLIQKVNKLIELPTDEIPTVATVSDINKLKDQPFFAHAKNGDKVLFFAKNKKAILYRPSENKLVEVAFYNPPQASQTSPAPSNTTAKVRLAIYNGTKTPGLAKSEGDKLVASFPNLEVTSTANAAGEYSKTLVVDLSGKNKATADSLAKQLNGEVGSLPSQEASPQNADLLIILAAK